MPLKKCRRKIGEYMGSGGPPLFAPLQFDELCERNFGHNGKCMSKVDKVEEMYDKRIRGGKWR